MLPPNATLILPKGHKCHDASRRSRRGRTGSSQQPHQLPALSPSMSSLAISPRIPAPAIRLPRAMAAQPRLLLVPLVALPALPPALLGLLLALLVLVVVAVEAENGGGGRDGEDDAVLPREAAVLALEVLAVLALVRVGPGWPRVWRNVAAAPRTGGAVGLLAALAVGAVVAAAS